MENKKTEYTKLQSLISQAYVALPFILAAEFLIELGQISIGGGSGGITIGILWMLTIIFAVSVFMQMLVKFSDNKTFKWIVFGVTLALVIGVMQHQLSSHIGRYLTEGIINLYTPLDLTFDVIGIWAVIMSWKWARLKK